MTWQRRTTGSQFTLSCVICLLSAYPVLQGIIVRSYMTSTEQFPSFPSNQSYLLLRMQISSLGSPRRVAVRHLNREGRRLILSRYVNKTKSKTHTQFTYRPRTCFCYRFWAEISPLASLHHSIAWSRLHLRFLRSVPNRKFESLC